MIGGANGVVSYAVSDNSDDSGSWNRGLHNGNNGYYMAYSYYYHNSAHYSWATLNNKATGNIHAPGGYTSMANTNSYKNSSWSAGCAY